MLTRYSPTLFMNIAKKITFLNETALKSLNERSSLAIVKNFTEAGIKILGADFGFAWWKHGQKDTFHLVYKSKNTPYEPNYPRKRGGNYEAIKNKTPFFVSEA